MKSTLLLVSALVTATASAQDDKLAILQWQSLHPATLLISADRYDVLSPEERQLLGKDVFVFREPITIEQLNSYPSAKTNLQGEKEPLTKTEDLEIIKDWRAKHPGVGIIPQSKYTGLSEFRRQQAHTRDYIILAGEHLTVKDIADYTALYGQ